MRKIAIIDDDRIVLDIVDEPGKDDPPILGYWEYADKCTSCIIGHPLGELRAVANERHALNLAKINARAITDDQTASAVQSLLPEMQYNGELIKVGTYIQWADETYKAAQDLWDTEQNNPDNAPTLWERIMYHEGYRIIPEVFTPALAFSAGEIGYWPKNGKFYRAINNGTTWTPEAHPPAWEEATDA